MGFFIIGVLAAAWFGGAGPGVLAAFLSAISLPHLMAITYPLSVSYPLLAGFLDLPRFIALGLTGAAVGWGRTSYRRAESALRERKRAEEAPRKSQQRYERVLDGAEVGDWEWDIVTGDYFVSARMRQMLEMPPDLHFTSREDFLAHVPFHPDDRESYLEASKRNIAVGRRTVEHDYRVVLQNGAVRWMRVRGKSTRNAQGVVTHFSGSLVDNTERKLAAQALRESEERYSLAMEASEEGHFDINLDTDELFTSERFNEIHGFAPGTRFGTRTAYLKQIRFYGNDAETFYAAAKATLAKDAPERYRFEYRILLPSGEMRWVRMSGKVTRDAEDRARRRTGVVADITAHKVAEEALRLSEERYALALEVTEEGHFDWNVQTDQIFASAAAIRIVNLAQDAEYRTRGDITSRLLLSPGRLGAYRGRVACGYRRPRIGVRV